VIGYCGQFVREWPKQTKCWATFYHGKTCASILTKKLLAFWVVFFHKLIRSPCTCFTHFRCRASNKLFFFCRKFRGANNLPMSLCTLSFIASELIVIKCRIYLERRTPQMCLFSVNLIFAICRKHSFSLIYLEANCPLLIENAWFFTVNLTRTFELQHLSTATSWGRCYDHNFRRKNGILKPNVMI
jgi:hypothetical protein